jgi:hypothetical protein
MSELLTPEEYMTEMARNKFTIQDGRVVCGLCSGDCGQCGNGAWMRQCQEYHDVNKIPKSGYLEMFALGVFIVVSLTAIGTLLFLY